MKFNQKTFIEAANFMKRLAYCSRVKFPKSLSLDDFMWDVFDGRYKKEITVNDRKFKIDNGYFVLVQDKKEVVTPNKEERKEVVVPIEENIDDADKGFYLIPYQI